MMLAGLFLLVGIAMAQTKVTGTVVGFEDNEPIIGATIQAVGNASIGTITDYDGNFTLDVPEGVKTLKITYVGMEPLEVAVSTKTLKIQLINDSQILDEVVVVAYGTQKKTSLTGSIQEVKSEAIEMRPTSSVAAALEGTVTGVQVNSTYGAPGSDPSIRIRGVGTVNGSSSPLYILDGVPYNGNISDLNPQDIESMSVLKDAASAALYGNRASNGVILITTKKGKQGKMNVSLDIKQGTYSRGIPDYDRLGAREWMEAQWLNMKNYAFQQQLHWSHEFGVHSVDALLAHENYDYTVNELYANKNIEIEPGLNNLLNFAEPVSVYDANEYYHTESYLGRVRYGYDSRYNIEFSCSAYRRESWRSGTLYSGRGLCSDL